MCPRQTLKKLSASFRFFFPGTHVFYLKPLLWRDFLLHYSLLFDRVSRISLSHPLHIKTRWQCPHYLSPHRWSQIRPNPVRCGRWGGAALTLSPSAMEEADAHHPLGAGAGPDEGPPRPCSLPSCGQIPPARLSDISPTWGITSFGFHASLYLSNSLDRCMRVFIYTSTPQLPMYIS